MQVDIDFKHLQQNFNDAQYVLDNAIMTSMVPLMPMQDGSFIDKTKGQSGALAGSGKVVAAASPYGRFLYEGKKMVDTKTGKGPLKITNEFGEEKIRWRKGAKLKPTNEPLSYSRGRTDHWFEKAKDRDCDNWVNLVKKEMGK